jgi:hypothetical protein
MRTMSIIKSTMVLLLIATMVQSCTKDLDLEPRYGINSATVYNEPANYINVLAKAYAGLAVSGNQGPAGNADIQGLDEGFSQYTRVLWNLQELPTDEAVCGWGDTGIPELNTHRWSASNTFSKAGYSRIFFQVTLCNEFIRECSDENMDRRGFSDTDKDRIRGYRAEARFLRALSYWHAIDLFGSVPFVTEEDGIGAFLPEQISRSALFDYVVSELRAIESELPAAMTNEYGRADKGACQMLLAKLYLNSEVYTGVPRYADAATYAQRVIDGGYQLSPNYEYLFLADNHTMPAKGEIVFPVRFDGANTQTWGGGTFFVHAFMVGSMSPNDFGVNGGWNGYRARQAFSSILSDSLDGRNLFHTDGQQQLVENTGTSSHGYGVGKYKNVDKNGLSSGSDPSGNHVDMDFPMFRLADAYLIYAECAARGAADVGMGINYINLLRERAYGNSSNNVSSLDLDLILDERARELYWEGHRRTDLIRFGKFAGGEYLWEFKGDVAEGTSIPEYLKLYPLSADDVIANPNLQQNEGY